MITEMSVYVKLTFRGTERGSRQVDGVHMGAPVGLSVLTSPPKVFPHCASHTDQGLTVTVTCPPFSGESHEGIFVCLSHVAG